MRKRKKKKRGRTRRSRLVECHELFAFGFCNSSIAVNPSIFWLHNAQYVHEKKKNYSLSDLCYVRAMKATAKTIKKENVNNWTGKRLQLNPFSKSKLIFVALLKYFFFVHFFSAHIEIKLAIFV